MMTVKISSKRPIIPTRAQVLDEELKKLEIELGKLRRTLNYMARNRDQKYTREEFIEVYEKIIKTDYNISVIRSLQAKNFMEVEADERQRIRKMIREKEKLFNSIMCGKVEKIEKLVQDEEETREYLIQIHEFELKLMLEANDDEDRAAEKRDGRVKMTDAHKVRAVESFEFVSREDIMLGEKTDFANLIKSF